MCFRRSKYEFVCIPDFLSHEDSFIVFWRMMIPDLLSNQLWMNQIIAVSALQNVVWFSVYETVNMNMSEYVV